MTISHKMDDMSGFKKYKYRKEIRVGGGAFGDVYKGRLLNGPSAGQTVAIKELKNARQSAAAVEKALREASVLIMLGPHPNIVDFLGLGQEKISGRTSLGMVFEFCERGTLKTYLQDAGNLTEDQLPNLMLQIRAGLKHIHDAEMMHCDLKPDNILVTSDGQLKIADFGLVKIMGKLVSFEQSIQSFYAMGGTFGYIDPSVVKLSMTQRKILGSRQWDLWSMGAILYEMFCKVPLFGNSEQWNNFVALPLNSSQLVIDRMIQIKFPRSASAQVKDLLVRCLQTDPAKRISVKEFYDHPWWSAGLRVANSWCEDLCLLLKCLVRAVCSMIRDLVVGNGPTPQ